MDGPGGSKGSVTRRFAGGRKGKNPEFTKRLGKRGTTAMRKGSLSNTDPGQKVSYEKTKTVAGDHFLGSPRSPHHAARIRLKGELRCYGDRKCIALFILY